LIDKRKKRKASYMTILFDRDDNVSAVYPFLSRKRAQEELMRESKNPEIIGGFVKKMTPADKVMILKSRFTRTRMG
jgi:hypothetical protein